MSRNEKPSHIPLFVDSYLADTTHLTTEQHGAYLLLMMAAWRSADCTLPHDERRLASFAGVPIAKWRKIGPDILEMWTCQGGRCYQKRLLKEWEYVREKSAKRKSAANSRWSNGDANAHANALHVECTKGGGGGGGVNPYQEEGFVRGAGFSRDTGPFSVITGGAK